MPARAHRSTQHTRKYGAALGCVRKIFALNTAHTSRQSRELIGKPCDQRYVGLIVLSV